MVSCTICVNLRSDNAADNGNHSWQPSHPFIGTVPVRLFSTDEKVYSRPKHTHISLITQLHNYRYLLLIIGLLTPSKSAAAWHAATPTPGTTVGNTARRSRFATHVADEMPTSPVERSEICAHAQTYNQELLIISESSLYCCARGQSVARLKVNLRNQGSLHTWPVRCRLRLTSAR